MTYEPHKPVTDGEAMQALQRAFAECETGRCLRGASGSPGATVDDILACYSADDDLDCTGQRDCGCIGCREDRARGMSAGSRDAAREASAASPPSYSEAAYRTYFSEVAGGSADPVTFDGSEPAPPAPGQVRLTEDQIDQLRREAQWGREQVAELERHKTMKAVVEQTPKDSHRDFSERYADYAAATGVR